MLKFTQIDTTIKCYKITKLLNQYICEQAHEKRGPEPSQGAQGALWPFGMGHFPSDASILDQSTSALLASLAALSGFGLPKFTGEGDKFS